MENINHTLVKHDNIIYESNISSLLHRFNIKFNTKYWLKYDNIDVNLILYSLEVFYFSLVSIKTYNFSKKMTILATNLNTFIIVGIVGLLYRF